jgi:hypothetical protein
MGINKEITGHDEEFTFTQVRDGEHLYKGQLNANKVIFEVLPVGMYAIEISLYDGCPYLAASSSEMKQETLLAYSGKIEVTVMKVQLDFEDGDLDAGTNTVSYPWRFSCRLWGRPALTFILRLVLYRRGVGGGRGGGAVEGGGAGGGGDAGNPGEVGGDEVEACTVVKLPSEVDRGEDGKPFTAKCDLFLLREEGTLSYGNYSALLYLHEAQEFIEDVFEENLKHDPYTIIPASHLGQLLVQSPIRLIQLSAPKPASYEHGHWKVDEPRDGDQVIRIETFHGLLGNALVQMGTAFTLAHQVGANVLRLPVAQKFEPPHIERHFVDSDSRAFGQTLLDFFPRLPEYMRLSVPPSSRWKGELTALLALKQRYQELAEQGEGSLAIPSHKRLQDILAPFGVGFQYAFPRQGWLPSIVRRCFLLTLLPFLPRLPTEDRNEGDEEALLVHFRSGNTHTYRNSYHMIVRKHSYQPPLGFYIVAIETHLRRFPHSPILLLTQPLPALQNLCIEPILNMYPQASLLSSGSAVKDFVSIVDARHIVLSRSTFAWMGSLLAPRIKTLYSPDFLPARWREAPFDFFDFKFPGFYQLLVSSVSSDWRIGEESKPLDFDVRLKGPTLDYDPRSVLCELLDGDDRQAARSSRGRSSENHAANDSVTNRQTRCLLHEELDKLF